MGESKASALREPSRPTRDTLVKSTKSHARLLEEMAIRGPSSAADLARVMGLHLTTVLYHLRRAQKTGAIAQRYGLWFLVGVRAAPTGPRLGPTMERALSLLAEHPGLDHSSLACLLGVSRPAVTALVARLAFLGYVEVEARSRRKFLQLARRVPMADASTGSVA